MLSSHMDKIQGRCRWSELLHMLPEDSENLGVSETEGWLQALKDETEDTRLQRYIWVKSKEYGWNGSETQPKNKRDMEENKEYETKRIVP